MSEEEIRDIVEAMVDKALVAFAEELIAQAAINGRDSISVADLQCAIDYLC